MINTSKLGTLVYLHTLDVHIMYYLSLPKYGLSEYAEKNTFFFNLNNSEKYRLSFEDIFLGTLDTYTKKMNPSSTVLGGGEVHGKGSWLIAYEA